MKCVCIHVREKKVMNKEILTFGDASIHLPVAAPFGVDTLSA